MSAANPKSFKDLKEEELKKIATYFGTDEEGGKDGIIADLVENGVSFADYETQILGKENIIKSTDTTVKEVPVVEVREEVVTAAQHPVLAQANYLIKMDRKNPYFEFRQYRFTKDNPYNVMPAEDAQDILTKEDGFRQAFPDELQEYYS